MTQPTIPDVPQTLASPAVAAAMSWPDGVEAAAASPGEATPEHACANCGSLLLGPYCAQCGQKAAHRIVSLSHILEDALEDQLSLNAAIPRTLAILVRHPGLLTREYISGRVVSYIPPMRLYLIASVLFFLVMATVPDTTQFDVRGPSARPTAGAAAAPGKRSGVTTSAPVMIRIDTTGATGWRGRFFRRVGQQMARVSALQQREASRVLTAKVADSAPKVLFAMVPIFALILKLLYVRRRRLYVEHFVFALHLHALAFLAFTPLLIVQSISHSMNAPRVTSAAQLLVFLGLTVYLLLAMRTVYGQGWGRTLTKWALLAFSYGFVVALGMTTMVLIALFEV